MKSRLSRLDAVSWSGFAVFAMSSVVTPVCLPEITKSIPTTLSQSGAIETARNFMILALLILATAFASLQSKKSFLAQGNYLIAAGMFLASFVEGYILLVLSIMIMGLGGGLVEAFLNPLIVDIHPRNPGKFLNLSNAFYPLGVMSSSIIFGELLTLEISWRIIFKIGAASALLIGLSFSLLNFPPTESHKNSLKSFGDIFSNKLFFLFAAAIFLGGGIESALTFWGRSFVAEYISAVPRAGAAAVMIFAVSMFAGRLLTAFFSSRFELNQILISSTLLGTAVGFIIPYAENLTEFYLLIALAGLATACFWPTILAEASRRLDVNTTLLFILLACSGVIGFGITPWIMGIVGDYLNLRGSLAVVPFYFLILMGLLLFEQRHNSEKRKISKTKMKENNI